MCVTNGNIIDFEELQAMGVGREVGLNVKKSNPIGPRGGGPWGFWCEGLLWHQSFLELFTDPNYSLMTILLEAGRTRLLRFPLSAIKGKLPSRVHPFSIILFNSRIVPSSQKTVIFFS